MATQSLPAMATQAPPSERKRLGAWGKRGEGRKRTNLC